MIFISVYAVVAPITVAPDYQRTTRSPLVLVGVNDPTIGDLRTIFIAADGEILTFLKYLGLYQAHTVWNSSRSECVKGRESCWLNEKSERI